MTAVGSSNSLSFLYGLSHKVCFSAHTHMCMYIQVLGVGREGNPWQVELNEKSGPLQVTRPAWILQINSRDLHF